MDFISGSKIILDLDRKSLAIPDSQIDKVVKTIEEGGKVEIDLSKIRLEEKQKQELGANDVAKTAITKVPVLKLPDLKMPFELFTDASSIVVGAVLNQEQRPVVFAFRTLRGAEKNYTVTERECLTVNDQIGMELAEFNIESEHRSGTQNAVADVLSRNPVENIGEKVNCAIIRDLVLSSRDQLIEEPKTDPELGHIYRYLENPKDTSVNATICENWSRDFRLIEGLLFYPKYATSLGEIGVYVPKSLRNEIMREFLDKPVSSHFGRFKTRVSIK
ncbi:hypothetical protein TNCV_158491 [Trichonephila clavipes]|uniref:Reverse transcriptase/retrotransposon-derived protein RNase H-like domain-containing protein n=1 Tax=Trichonephila clavipes TaxID=2585209 RepID=A0A8X6R424_TRICX|nr:hypothetical protein TNCV_158491 [Trichonephila clavipes]